MFNRIFDFSRVIFSTPVAGLGVWPVILRNFKIFSQTAWTHLLLSFVEPLLVWAAFGYFLGHWIPNIGGVEYINYLFPTMVGLTGAQVSYFESTLGSLTKLNRNRVYRSWSYSALSENEIVLGEILWGTIKGTIACVALILLGWIGDMITFQGCIQIVFISFLGCYVFSSFGFWVATKKGSSEKRLGLIQVFFILPMYLFSNTFFPVQLVVTDYSNVVHFFPLANVMTLLRAVHQHSLDSTVFFSLGYLVVWGVCFTNLATLQWKNRFRS